MLQKKANPAIAGLKAALSLPLLAVLIFTFSERVYAQSPPPSPKVPSPSGAEVKPPDIDVFIVKTEKGKDSKATIRYKNGKEVSGDVSTPEKKKAFEKEHGVKLPPPPPPPPPPSQKKKMAVPPPPPPEPPVKKMETMEAPPPPPASPKKTKMPAPPPPPPPSKSEQIISFTPPVIVKDKEVQAFAPPVIVNDKKVNEVPGKAILSTKKPQEPIGATKKAKQLNPPVIVAEGEVYYSITR